MSFELSNCIAFVTSSTVKAITEDFDRRLKKKGSTRKQWTALYFINSNKDITQNDLAKKMSIQDPSLARLLDRMQRDSLILRIENAGDRRKNFLELTQKGHDIIEALSEEGERFCNILIENITNDELECFESTLKKMLNNIK